MNKKKFTKLLALYLPYLVIGLAATNLGEAWRKAKTPKSTGTAWSMAPPDGAHRRILHHL